MPYAMAALRHLDAEQAHDMGIRAARLLPAAQAVLTSAGLAQNIWGLRFPNPIGLAAGFDKNAAIGGKMFRFGFGFVEMGTVTPKPQSGNPKPRLFRLNADRAIINRLGFNNQGLEIFVKNFARARATAPPGAVLGANIGMNRDAAQPLADIENGLRAVYPLADYVTINISSPNTPGLRAWQEGDGLESLLQLAKTTQSELRAAHGYRPILCKLAPDLSYDQIEFLAQTMLRHGLDGAIISNTTTARPKQLESPHAAQSGGLSGRPLFVQATNVLRQFYRLSGGKIPLIGVGGIGNAQDVLRKVKAGASLVQLYTGLVYHGPYLAETIATDLAELLRRQGIPQLSQAIGIESEARFDHNPW